MSHDTRRPAGAMTRAMSTQRAHDGRPRVLRLGVLQHESMIEERIVRERATVTVGTTERATVTVHAEAFPAHTELFVLRDNVWHLRVDPKAEGRVASGGTVRALDAWRCDPQCVTEGDAALLPLDDASRGKLTLAGVTFLFQFVPAPPEAPRPQVPIALRRSLTRELDWRYNASLACFFSVAIGALAWIEYGYDPIVDDNSELLELVSRRVRFSALDDTPPEPPPNATPNEASAPAAEGPPSPSPRHTDRPAPNTTAPRAPSATEVARMAQRAEEAAARATRTAMANFDAIAAMAQGPNSAVDRLQNQVGMDTTAANLRDVGGISTRAPSAIGRSTAQASTHGIPGSQRLGEQRAVATGEGPATSAPPHERTITCTNCFTPHAPETDTCEGDASAVARSLRTNIGGIRACYERISRTIPTLRGRLVMRFSVGESGRAMRISVSGVNDDLDQCVERALARIVFPAATCGEADYEYPVTVSPAE
jgi:hypothetical protein